MEFLVGLFMWFSLEVSQQSLLYFWVCVGCLKPHWACDL